jgi:hypothetical protein
MRHIEDARLAVGDFRRNWGLSCEGSALPGECMNLLGAALLRTGWSFDVTLLSTPFLVSRSGHIPSAGG